MPDPRGTRLPRKIKLMGYDIPVKQVDEKTLQKVLGEPRPLEGVWDDENTTIYINRQMSLRKKRLAVWHEIQHAVVDLKDRE